MPVPLQGLTAKNKRALRQFDDPAVLRRLYSLPERLWIRGEAGEKTELPHARQSAGGARNRNPLLHAAETAKSYGACV